MEMRDPTSDEELAGTMREIFGVDPRSLALFRIAIALVILFDLGVRAQDLTTFYTDHGVLPRAAVIAHTTNTWAFSLHFLSGTVLYQMVLFTIAAVFASWLLVGYRTRLATVASWVLLVSLQNRNPPVLHGGDQLLRLLLFWGMFLPLGIRFSLDRARDVGDGEHAGERPILSPGSIGLLAQMLFLYTFGAFLKTGDAWVDGTAVHYILSLSRYTTPFGSLLLPYPEVMRFLTLAVWYLEAWGIGLMFLPWGTGWFRMIFVTAFVGLQVSFGMSMFLGIFPLVSTAGILPFLPSLFWDRLLPSLGSPSITRLPLIRSFYTFWYDSGGWQRTMSPRPAVHRGGREYQPHRVARCLAAFFVIYVAWWNLGTISNKYKVPKPYRWICGLLRLDQKWSMFAPYPDRNDGWYVIPARLSNGKQIDLYSGASPVSWERPPSIGFTFENFRWRKFMAFLQRKDYVWGRRYYAEYLCRTWKDRGHRADLLDFEIVMMLEKTLPDFTKTPPKRVSLWKQDCTQDPPPETAPEDDESDGNLDAKRPDGTGPGQVPD